MTELLVCCSSSVSCFTSSLSLSSTSCLGVASYLACSSVSWPSVFSKAPCLDSNSFSREDNWSSSLERERGGRKRQVHIKHYNSSSLKIHTAILQYTCVHIVLQVLCMLDSPSLSRKVRPVSETSLELSCTSQHGLTSWALPSLVIPSLLPWGSPAADSASPSPSLPVSSPLSPVAAVCRALRTTVPWPGGARTAAVGEHEHHPPQACSSPINIHVHIHVSRVDGSNCVGNILIVVCAYHSFSITCICAYYPPNCNFAKALHCLSSYILFRPTTITHFTCGSR